MGLLPDIPTDISAMTIGTCYNPMTRKLITNVVAIDPDKLPNSLILETGSIGELKVCAGSESAKNTSQSYFGMDSKIRVKLWANINFNMSKARSDVATERALSCSCSHVFRGKAIELKRLDATNRFTVMTDGFQAALQAIADA